jgi:predicted GNAT family N-acyltransferase
MGLFYFILLFVFYTLYCIISLKGDCVLNFKFRLAKAEEVEEVFTLYIAREKWLHERDINQWVNYTTRYPLEDLQQFAKQQQLYVLTKQNEIVASVVLLTKDHFWKENCNNTIYIKKLVSKVSDEHYGKVLLEHVFAFCKQRNITTLRLDCRSDNAKLNEFYQNFGFIVVGKAHYTTSDANLYELKLK